MFDHDQGGIYVVGLRSDGFLLLSEAMAPEWGISRAAFAWGVKRWRRLRGSRES